jgi:hypothetical protein
MGIEQGSPATCDHTQSYKLAAVKVRSWVKPPFGLA